jgi:hypothetical protein
MSGIIFCTIVIGLIEGFTRDNIFRNNYLIASTIIMYLQFPKQTLIKMLEVRTFMEYTLFYFFLICATIATNFISFYIPYIINRNISNLLGYKLVY